MSMRSFDYILSDEILNNIFSDQGKEDVSTAIIFPFGQITGEHSSFETHHSPDPEIFPRENEMVVMSADGSYSDLSIPSDGNYKHTRRMFSSLLVNLGITQGMGENMKWFIKRVVTKSYMIIL